MDSFLNWLKDFGIIAILAGSTSTLITVWLTQRWQRKAEAQIELRKSREEQYKNLLNNLMGFFEGWEDYGMRGSRRKRKKQFLWDIYTNASVYASDEVLKLCYRFIQAHSNPGERKQTDSIYAQIVLAIRKELNKIYGEPDTQLSEDDIKIMKLD